MAIQNSGKNFTPTHHHRYTTQVFTHQFKIITKFSVFPVFKPHFTLDISKVGLKKVKMTTKLGLCNEKTFIAMKNIHFKTVEEEEKFAIYIVTRITKVNFKLRV